MTTNQDGLRQRIRQALNGQKQKTVTVLSCLLAVEDELGYIPEAAIEEVSCITACTINDVWGVASFYTNFRFEPPGSHTVEVCWGPTCHVLGAMNIIDAVSKSLCLPGEGTTDDRAVSLRLNTCLAACGNGPVMSVDHKLVGRVTPEQAKEMMLQLRKICPNSGGHVV